MIGLHMKSPEIKTGCIYRLALLRWNPESGWATTPKTIWASEHVLEPCLSSVTPDKHRSPAEEVPIQQGMDAKGCIANSERRHESLFEQCINP